MNFLTFYIFSSFPESIVSLLADESIFFVSNCFDYMIYQTIIVSILMARNPNQSAECSEGSQIRVKFTLNLRRNIRLQKEKIMVHGVRRFSKNTRGLFVQMHNASSSDLLWGGKSFKRSSRSVSNEYFPVEQLISKKSSGGTVSLF